VNAIALAWDAVTAGEIAKQTRLSSKVVSAQLSSLVKNEIVSRILTTTKNHLYQVNERFFNIWYLMRHGNRGDKRKVRWLVRFLEEWCDDREIVRRTHQHVQALKKGGYDERGAYYMAEALAQTRHLPGDAQHELLSVTRDFLKKQGSEFERYLSESDKELHEKAVVFYGKREWEKALPILLKMKELDEFRIGVCYYFIKEIKKAENFYLKAVEKEHADAMFNLALLYKTEFKDLKKAEKYYLQAVDKGHASAMHNLAHLYSTEFKDFKKAEKFYLQAIEKGEVRAILKLAHLYETEFKKFEEAEKLYLQAVEKGQAKAMHDLAHFYENKFEDYKKAEKFFLMAVENGDTKASGCLANLYYAKLKDSQRAEKFYLQAIEKGDDRSLSGLALLHQTEYKDFKKAEKLYLQTIEKGHVETIYNLAYLYHNEFEDFKKAEKFYLQAIEKGDDRALPGLALLYHIGFKDFKKAERFYLQAVEKGNAGAMYALAGLYEFEFKDFKKAEKFYLQAIENGIFYDEAIIEQSKEVMEYTAIPLLARQHYQLLHDTFTSPQAEALHLKDRLKPIWYALMYYLQDQYPNEYLRMGDELKETVEEIIAEVEKLREEMGE
jgi:TPR repeat protein/DNA-binding transcriptional regulator GbsR (MarR family)